METYLCHSCFERNSKDAEVCSNCNAQLKEKENDVQKYMQSLTYLSKRHKFANPREFKLLIIFNLMLSLNYMVIASFLNSIDPYYVSMDFFWYVISFYVSSLLTLWLTHRIVLRRRSVIKSILYLLPLQIGLLTAFIINMKLVMLNSSTISEIIPEWMMGDPDWHFYLLLYCVMLAIVFSMQVYFILFNHQVRRQLVF